MGRQTPLGAMESPHTLGSRGGLSTPGAAAEASVGPHHMSAGASVYPEDTRVPPGSASACAAAGWPPSSLGLRIEPPSSARGNFESTEQNTSQRLAGKGANGSLEVWLTGAGKEEEVDEPGGGRSM